MKYQLRHLQFVEVGGPKLNMWVVFSICILLLVSAWYIVLRTVGSSNYVICAAG